MSNYRKRIPYGMMNFVDVRKDDCYFVDKTRFIPTTEQANKFFFFIRPRRFGKSLLVSTLKAYFQGKKELFRGLAIDAQAPPQPRAPSASGRYRSELIRKFLTN